MGEVSVLNEKTADSSVESLVPSETANDTPPLVLIADDDRTTRLLLTGLLTKWGYPVEVRSDGTGVLESLQKPDGPAIALLDWEMPGMDGADICRRLRTHYRGNGVYAILLSGRTAVEDIAEGLASGADDYMRKPCDARELHSRIHAGERLLLSRRQLRESERWHRSLLEHLPLPIVTVEVPSLEVKIANRIAGAVFGEELCEEGIGRSLLDLFPELLANGQRTEDALKDLLEQSKEKVVSSDWLCRRRDGSIFPAILQMTRVRRDASSYAQVALMDVTDQKLLEERLEEKVALRTQALHESHAQVQLEKERAQQYLDVAGVALLVLDRSGCVTMLNVQGCELLSLELSEVEGQKWFERFVPDEERQRAEDLFSNLLKGAVKDVEFCESQIVTSKGERKWVVWHNVPLCDANDNVVGMLSSGQDVTERRRIEAQLLRAQKLESVGQLASGLAHEMNTPLQFVSDNVHFLQKAVGRLLDLSDKHVELVEQAKGGEIDDELLKGQKKAISRAKMPFLKKQLPNALEQTAQGLRRIAQLVESMKTFAEPNTLEMDQEDLNEMLLAMLAESDEAESSSLKIEAVLDNELPGVKCLSSNIRKVVLEMLSNARDAIEAREPAQAEGPPLEPGQITVTTSHDENWVTILVRDNGVGMSEEVARRVYDPFYTTKVVGKGTGQGMAVAHSIVVDKHGGALEVESSVGVGTLFTIRLPRTSRSSPSEA